MNQKNAKGNLKITKLRPEAYKLLSLNSVFPFCKTVSGTLITWLHYKISTACKCKFTLMYSFESVAKSISRNYIFVALPWHAEGKRNGYS